MLTPAANDATTPAANNATTPAANATMTSRNADTSTLTPSGIALEDLSFSEIGVVALRSYLGEGPVYERFKSRFDAADLAWFVAGAHKDDRHEVLPNTFHPDWHLARATTATDKDAVHEARYELRKKLKELVLDALTVLSRGFGCTPLLLNVDGTVEPKKPISLETLKIDVSLPPHVLAEGSGLQIVLAEIVQKYAEGFGLPAVHRWYRAFKKAGFNIQPPTAAQSPIRRVHAPLVPPPNPGTNHYVFRGRPVGEINDIVDQLLKVSTPSDRNGPARRQGLEVTSSSRERIDDVDDNTDDENNILRAHIEDLTRLIQEKDDEIARLRKQLVETSISSPAGRRVVAPPALTAPSPIRTSTPGRAAMPPALHPSEAVSQSARVSAPTSLAPAPSRPNTPSPLPSRGIRTPPPTGTLARGPAHQRAGKSPEKAINPTAASVSSITSRLSSVVSISDWSASVPSSPVADGLHVPWEMPTVPTQPPFLSPSRSVASPSRASVSSPLRRFDVVGPVTARVVSEVNLPNRIHRELSDLILNFPHSQWADALRDWGLPDDVIDVLISAIVQDVPVVGE